MNGRHRPLNQAVCWKKKTKKTFHFQVTKLTKQYSHEMLA